MTGEEIEKALGQCSEYEAVCPSCAYWELGECQDSLHKDAYLYICRLKTAKQLAETQLKELLSVLYRETDGEKGFTLYRKDIVELANDYGIKEEDLK